MEAIVAADDAEAEAETEATETIVLESALLAAAADSAEDERAKAGDTLSPTIADRDFTRDRAVSAMRAFSKRRKREREGFFFFFFFFAFLKKARATDVAFAPSLFLFFFPHSFNRRPSQPPNLLEKNMSGLARVISPEASDDGYEPKTILITGAAGFIGSHTALRLVKNLPNVRVS